MLVVALHLQAVVVVLCRVVHAVVGARAGDNNVRGPPCPEAIEQLAVIVLRHACCVRSMGTNRMFAKSTRWAICCQAIQQWPDAG